MAKRKADQAARATQALSTSNLAYKFLTGAVQLLCGNAPTTSTTSIAPSNAGAVPTSNGMLLPSNRASGIDMSIEVFCKKYSLQPQVQELLDTEGYANAASLAYVKIADLDAAGFKSGHYYALMDVVKKWSLSAFDVHDLD